MPFRLFYKVWPVPVGDWLDLRGNAMLLRQSSFIHVEKHAL
jgi:hypothetical protein